MYAGCGGWELAKVRVAGLRSKALNQDHLMEPQSLVPFRPRMAGTKGLPSRRHRCCSRTKSCGTGLLKNSFKFMLKRTGPFEKNMKQENEQA